MLEEIKKKPIIIGGILVLIFCIFLFGNSIMRKAQYYSGGIRYKQSSTNYKYASEYEETKPIEAYQKQNISLNQEQPQLYAKKDLKFKIVSQAADRNTIPITSTVDTFNGMQTEKENEEKKEMVAEKNNIYIDIKTEDNKKQTENLSEKIKYDINFKGDFLVKNPFGKEKGEVEFYFPLPQSSGTLSNVDVLVDKKEPENVNYSTNGMNWNIKFKPSEQKTFTVTYQTKGADSFSYKVTHGNRIKLFNLKMKIEGIDKTEIPEFSIPTTKKTHNGNTWELEWNLVKMITVNDILVQFSHSLDVINQKEQILILSQYIPLFLGIFFIYLIVGSIAEKIKINLEQYFLLLLNFFLYYPLLGYLSGLLDLKIAIIFSAVIICLIMLNHLRRITNFKFALSYGGTIFLIAFLIIPFGTLYRQYSGIIVVICSLFLIEAFIRISQKINLTKTVN